jgi:uncharacterized protein
LRFDLKILNVDIETSPGKAWIWDLKTRYVSPNMLIEPKRMLSFAAKWHGEKGFTFQSRWHDGQFKMVDRLHGLLDEADAVIHYNGDRFDRPTINTEFALLDILPPSPTPNIDLMKTVKKHFAFMSNKLDYVTRQLGTDRKVENDGFALWMKVLSGDREAQKQMRLYNIGDILANESLYERLLPWIDGHPSMGLATGSHCCPNCGGMNLTKQGWYSTPTRAYQRYQCRECGKWSRDTKSIDSTSVTGVNA